MRIGREWFCGLLALALAADVLAAGPRSARFGADSCAYVARTGSGEYRYEHACAAALEAVTLAPWRDGCDELAAENLLEALAERPGQPRPSRFHILAKGRFLLEVPCRSGAYNQSSLFFAYDETRLPARVAPLVFPQPDGVPKSEVFARAVDGRRRLIVEYRKARGLGDAGYYARYGLDRGGSKVVLKEVIAKERWDGRDAFHWTGPIDRKPRGSGWRRLYPRAPRGRR